MNRILPWIFGAVVLVVASALQTEEEKIISKIKSAEDLISQYELELRFEECAELRDTIKELKVKLETLQNKKG